MYKVVQCCHETSVFVHLLICINKMESTTLNIPNYCLIPCQLLLYFIFKCNYLAIIIPALIILKKEKFFNHPSNEFASYIKSVIICLHLIFSFYFFKLNENKPLNIFSYFIYWINDFTSSDVTYADYDSFDDDEEEVNELSVLLKNFFAYLLLIGLAYQAIFHLKIGCLYAHCALVLSELTNYREKPNIFGLSEPMSTLVFLFPITMISYLIEIQIANTRTDSHDDLDDTSDDDEQEN